MKSLFVVLALAATVVVPVASAQVVHYSGVGSSAMWQGFAIAAYNDLALGTICVGGRIALGTGSSATPGDACTTGHWTVKTAGALAAAKDSRSLSIPLEYGNLWVAWVHDTTTGVDTDIWAYLSVDSTVGVRNYLAVPRAKLFVSLAATTTAGANAISNAFLVDGSKDNAVGLPADVYAAISGALGVPFTAGMTDIRPEDAKLATERILGSVPSPYGGDTVPATADPFIYSFSLGYGPGPIGLQIKSGEPGSTAAATPVEFSLPGGADPMSGGAVSDTINVYPVGESPIIFVANRSNTTTGLGQIVPSQVMCDGVPTVGCLSAPYTSDGSYQYRNLWDQHPYPPVANTFPNLTLTDPFCTANPSDPTCHIPRRPLGALFAGNDCETDMAAFSWPLDPNLIGHRIVPPNGTAEPITLFLREPLSGTYNTTEYSEVRMYGTPGGSLGTDGAGKFEATPYISQETNVVVGQPGADPLFLQCPAKYTKGKTGAAEGSPVGTGEVLNGPSAARINICAIGDSITSGYLSSPPTSPIAIMVSDLNTYTSSSNYVAVDQGIPGTTSADWANTGSGRVLNNAISVFNSAGGCNVVWYMIGTNDSKTAVATSWEGYKENLATTISYLEANGYVNIVLDFPPYINASSPWSVTSSNALLLSYAPTLGTIAAADSARVHVGDTSAYAYFQANTSLLQDGVHPSGPPANAGYTALARFWAAAYEGLFLTTPPPPDTAEGFRIRGIGTGEVLNGPAGIFDGIAGHGVLNTPDSIAYTFFSFGNVSKLATSTKYGYLMIDGIDPLFQDYSNTVGNPGQPATPATPLTWGELPACGTAPLPTCTVASIWRTSRSYPHLRDGTYPAWSELRMLCDPMESNPHCTVANDPLGAEAVVQNLQADIHFSRLGGVPDLLPFANGGVAAWNVPYGDVTYIRSHYNNYGPDDVNNAGAGMNEWARTNPSSTRQGGSNTLTGNGVQTYIDFSTEACSTGTVPGGTPVNGPPEAECGGDAGGSILPVGNRQTGDLQ